MIPIAMTYIAAGKNARSTRNSIAMNVTQKRSFLFLFTGIAVAAGFAAALRLELYRHLPRPHQLIFMMALLFIDVAAVGVLIWGALRLHSRIHAGLDGAFLVASMAMTLSFFVNQPLRSILEYISLVLIIAYSIGLWKKASRNSSASKNLTEK
jgi:uncharacterized membrane protein